MPVCAAVNIVLYLNEKEKFETPPLILAPGHVSYRHQTHVILYFYNPMFWFEKIDKCTVDL